VQKIDFTQEVNAANTELRAKQNHFQNSLNEIDGLLDTGTVKPTQILVTLQDAANCENAIEDLGTAFEVEERKHSVIKDGLRNGYQQKLDAIESKAVSKASSVISDVSGFKDLADQVKESVTNVSKRSPESIFSGTAYPASGPSNFSSARSEAQRAKVEFKKDAFKSYSNIAWWGAGGAAVLSWFSGVSFVEGLGVGGLVALGAFVVYGSKYNTSAGAIRRLVNSAETEFSNIRKEKLDSDNAAQKEYSDQSKVEDDRFNSVKTSFHDTVNVADLELAELADRLSKISEKWQDLNGHLFHRHLDGQPEQIDEDRTAALETRFAILGRASFSTITRSERIVDVDFVDSKKPKAPTNKEKNVKKEREKNAKRGKENSAKHRPNELVLGGIYRGRVNSILSFCALIDFLNFDNGFLFHENIVDRKIDHPSEVLYVGQEVWVKYLGLDPGGKKTLSMKDVDQIHGRVK